MCDLLEDGPIVLIYLWFIVFSSFNSSLRRTSTPTVRSGATPKEPWPGTGPRRTAACLAPTGRTPHAPAPTSPILLSSWPMLMSRWAARRGVYVLRNVQFHQNAAERNEKALIHHGSLRQSIPRWLVDRKSKGPDSGRHCEAETIPFGCCFVNVCLMFPVLFSSDGENWRSSFLTFAALCRLTFKVPAYTPYSHSVRQRPRQFEVCIDCSHFKPPLWSPNIRLVFCVLYNACWKHILYIAFVGEKKTFFGLWTFLKPATKHQNRPYTILLWQYLFILTAAASLCSTKGGNFGDTVEGLLWEFNIGSLRDCIITRYV